MEPIPISEIVLALLAIASLLFAFYGVVRSHFNSGSGYLSAAIGMFGLGVYVAYKSFLSWQTGIEMPDEAVYAQIGLVAFFLLASLTLFMTAKYEKKALDRIEREIDTRIEAARPTAQIIPLRWPKPP